MSFSVSGKSAIVTGAASGLGLAIAHHLVDRGASVMFADADEARLEAEIGEAARGDGPVQMFAGDLTRKLTQANLVSAAIEAFGRVDILVNAARACQLSAALDPEADLVEAMWAQNVLTTLRMCQQVARRMIHIAEKSGIEKGSPLCSIVNLSSVAAVRVQPELLGYSMASAAVEQMTRTLAVALAPQGVRVNAISIGSVMSSSLQSALRDVPGLRARIEAGTPLGRIAAPDELAETVQFLASEASAFVTGQILAVDGGRGLLDAVSAPAF